MIALLLVAAAGGAAWFLLDRRDRGQVIGRIDLYRTQYDFAGGRNYLDGLAATAPRRPRDPEVQRAVAELKRAEEAEDRRAAELAAVLRKAGGLAADDAAFGPLAEQAARLARTDADRAAVAAARAAAEQKGRDDKGHALLQQTAAQFFDLARSTDPAEIARGAAAVKALLDKTEALGQLSADVRESVMKYRERYQAQKDRGVELGKALDKQREEESLRGEIASARDRLVKGDVEAYLLACQRIERRTPASRPFPRPKSGGRWRRTTRPSCRRGRPPPATKRAVPVRFPTPAPACCC